jgi:transglutaminase-like putative cysteine protease
MRAAARAGSPAGAPARTRLARWRVWLQPQVSIAQREQREQALLLVAVAVAVLPHFSHLPLWSVVVLGGLWIWRAWLAQTLKPAPSRIIVVALLALLSTAVWIEHGTLWGRDASVHFLLMLIGLKVLEMRARRDVFVIVFLSLFVLETQFLFDQSPFTALVMLLAVGLLFFVLLSVSLAEGDVSIRGKLFYLARIFVLALPLTFTLFFLFPRLPVPLWGSFSADNSSSGGLSDTMRPGTMRQLLRNDAVALRAHFEGAVPAERNLYWRGPVFGTYDGETWLPLESAQLPGQDPPVVQVDPRSAVEYTVTLEANQRRDLLGLDFAALVDGVPTAQGRLTPTLQLRSLTQVDTRRRYTVRSYTTFSADAGARLEALADWLQLPPQDNPRAHQLAAELKARVADAGGAESEVVAALLDHFRREPFHYDIQAVNPVDVNSIDHFLFESRVGYCEHYASAFVFLARAAGIPARVVTGYQGGEINPMDGYLTVRQSDAHAWAEVWLAHRGWVRVDPTAAVAPDRVDRTLRDLPADEPGLVRRPQTWLHQWRLNREALENAWNQWFLSYSYERQRSLVSWIGLRPSAQNISLLAMGAFSVLLSLLTLLSLRRPAARDPLAELEARLRAKLARAGLAVPASMGLTDLEQHLAGRLAPASLAEAGALLRALERARYAPPARGRSPALAPLRRRLRQWRPQRAPA